MEFGRFYGEEHSHQQPHEQFQPQGVCWCKGEEVHLRTLIREEVEKSVKNVLVTDLLPFLQSYVLPPNSSSLPHTTESSALRRLRLQFKSNIPNNTLFTMTKIEDQCAFIEVELLDEFGRRVVDDLEFPLKIKFDVLDGDFNVEGLDWTQKDYNDKIFKPRQYKGELLKGECKVALTNGVISVGHLCVTDNSFHTRSGTFRLGATAEVFCSGVVIEGAVSEAFKVKERRLKSDGKLKEPSAESALCCLVGIRKNGPVYNRAQKEGIFTVGHFLQRLNTNAKELRSILKVSEANWNAIVKNARACKLPEIANEGSSHHDDGKSCSQIAYQEQIYKPNDVQTEQEREQLQQPPQSSLHSNWYPDLSPSWHNLNEDQGRIHGYSTAEFELPCDFGQFYREICYNSPQRDEWGIVPRYSVPNPITSKLLAACYVTKAAALFMFSVQQDSTSPQKRQRLH